jgi:tRNA A-37 threonylcarbamoyl transferase component Bud32
MHSDPDLKPGPVLAQGPSQVLKERWQVDERIGQGGTAVVYTGRDLHTGARVAIKVMQARLLQDPVARQRFQREGAALSRLNDPHVAQVFDYGETDDGHAWIVLEFLSGRTLGEELSIRQLHEQRPGLKAAEVVEVARQVLRALGTMWEAGLAHRDIKPDNLFSVKVEGQGLYVKVLDLGLAVSRTDTALTTDGRVVGTVAYMAPELFEQKPATLQSDLYALGHTLAHLIDGYPPYGKERAEVVMALHGALDRPVPLGQLASQHVLTPVLRRLLAKRASERYATVAEVLAAIDEAIQQGRQLAASARSGERPRPAMAGGPVAELPGGAGGFTQALVRPGADAALEAARAGRVLADAPVLERTGPMDRGRLFETQPLPKPTASRSSKPASLQGRWGAGRVFIGLTVLVLSAALCAGLWWRSTQPSIAPEPRMPGDVVAAPIYTPPLPSPSSGQATSPALLQSIADAMEAGESAGDAVVERAQRMAQSRPGRPAVAPLRQPEPTPAAPEVAPEATSGPPPETPPAPQEAGNPVVDQHMDWLLEGGEAAPGRASDAPRP